MATGIKLRSNLMQILLDDVDDPAELRHRKDNSSARRASFYAFAIAHVQSAEAAEAFHCRIGSKVCQIQSARLASAQPISIRNFEHDCVSER